VRKCVPAKSPSVIRGLRDQDKAALRPCWLPELVSMWFALKKGRCTGAASEAGRLPPGYIGRSSNGRTAHLQLNVLLLMVIGSGVIGNTPHFECGYPCSSQGFRTMKTRVKRSRIWKMPSEQFAELVQAANSVGDVLKAFGLQNQGGNNRTAYRRIVEEGLWDQKFKKGLDNNKHRKFGPSPLRVPDDKLFCDNSEHRRTTVRKRVITHNLIVYQCQICGNNGHWNNKPLSLVLDHINGINNDHRLENLRFLCSNCNSQTDTFAGRNNKS
jgi:hypothetical protein